jgi:hypothetical protein
VDFDGGVAQGEGVVLHRVTQALAKLVIAEFIDMPAVLADGECLEAAPIASGAGTRNVGVQGFQAMDQAVRGQPVQCPIDLRGRAESFLTQPVEQRIRTERPVGLLKRDKDSLLVDSQLHGNPLMRVLDIRDARDRY